MFAEKCRTCAMSDRVLIRWLSLMLSPDISASSLRRSTSCLIFPLGSRCAKIGLAFFENSSFVMMPKRCIKASSTVKLSFRLIGTVRLWVYTGLTFSGVKRTLNCVFIPMSSRCHASMLLKSIIRDTRLSRSSPVITESFHLDSDRLSVLKSAQLVGV